MKKNIPQRSEDTNLVEPTEWKYIIKMEKKYK